jgi:murein L,D-transpeptidase YcbB/YkuD
MIFRNQLFILSILILFILSCGKRKNEEFGKYMALVYQNKEYKKFNSNEYNRVFDLEIKKLSKNLHEYEKISKLYKGEENNLMMLNKFLFNHQIDTLSLYLANSKYHGLNPNYLHADSISKILKILKTKKFKNVADSYPFLAKLELYSADAFINYVNILKYGAINPKIIFSTYYVSNKRPTFDDALNTLSQVDLVNYIKEVQPKNGYYQRLMNLLINEGKNNSRAIMKLEKRKIYLSMERLRWPVEEYKGKYLLVNIPEYQLRLINNNKTIIQMKVCVGEAGGHETPILSGMVNHMQVNPVWNIPQSIANKEILESLKKDESYLESHDMVAYKNDSLIESYSVDWSKAQPDEYSFKQNPGADNSLGLIKFLFHNPYAIYLHDTPAKAKFDEKMRAVSHGCVRVEKPMLLAEFLLNNKVESDRIIKETEATLRGEKANSRWVNIKKPVPVFISYYTAFTDDLGNLVASDDVYGYDKLLLSKFEKFMAN